MTIPTATTTATTITMIKVMFLMALEYPAPLPRRRIDTRQADRGHGEHRSGSCSRFCCVAGICAGASAFDLAKCPPAVHLPDIHWRAAGAGLAAVVRRA